MAEDSFSDNLRQTGVIMKYEIRKYFRGKKIMLFSALLVLVLVFLTVTPYISGEGMSSDPAEVWYSYMSWVQFIVLLLATLFVSGAIVSEFEDRTALILLTKPVRRWSVFLGKVAAALAVGSAFVLVFYAATAAVSLAATGSVASSMLTSLGLALAYTAGTAGVAVLISSAASKFSVAAILTFAALLMVSILISHVLSEASIDPWFMLDVAGGHINDCLRVDGLRVWRDAAVMLVWGLTAGAAGYLVFRRREM